VVYRNFRLYVNKLRYFSTVILQLLSRSFIVTIHRLIDKLVPYFARARNKIILCELRVSLCLSKHDFEANKSSSHRRCAFWDVVSGSTPTWSSEGVSTDTSTMNESEEVVCYSRHLTNFAVIAVSIVTRCQLSSTRYRSRLQRGQGKFIRCSASETLNACRRNAPFARARQFTSRYERSDRNPTVQPIGYTIGFIRTPVRRQRRHTDEELGPSCGMKACDRL